MKLYFQGPYFKGMSDKKIGGAIARGFTFYRWYIFLKPITVAQAIFALYTYDN